MALSVLKYACILILVLPTSADHGTESVKLYLPRILVLPPSADHGTERVKIHLYLNSSAAYIG